MKRDELRALVLVVAASMCLSSSAKADLGGAKSFAVLSSGGNVTLKNRDRINKIPIPGAVSCPGAAGCRADVGGKTILMGRGNGAVPDQINANVIASATASQGLNCAGAAPGTTAICLGNNSEVTGTCVTAGGAVSKSGDCAAGTDTSGTNSDVTTLLPNAGLDAADFSAFLAALPATQSLSAIHLGTGGNAKITLAAGLNVISVPSVVTGVKATITISGDSNAMAVVNVFGGLLSLGNGASVVLSGGITPDRVIFNVEGSGPSVVLGDNSLFNGTILAPQQGLTGGNGNTPQPMVINGALLFGGDVSIGNNVDLNFYPLAQIARQVTIGVVGTVNINDLPPPVAGGGNNEADDFEPGPHIEEVPGKPSPPTFGSALSLTDPPPDVVLMQPIGFLGLGNTNSKVPPDTQLAAGNTRLVEMVNVSGAEYGKLSGNQIKSFDLGSMFLTNKGQGTDPRVLFDADTHTYFAAYELKTAGGDDIRLAVSDEPGDNWTIYEVRGNNVDTCFDQPKLGFSTGVVTLSWNDYKNASSCTNTPAANFTGAEYIVIQKIGLLARFGSVPAVIWGPDSSRFQIVPVQSLSPSGIQYAAYHNTGGSNFNVMAFEGIPGVFDVSFTENSYNIGSVSGPPSASQPVGGDANIATNDDRLLSAVWQNDNLWGAFNEGCTPSGDTSKRACERFVEVSTANNSVSQNVQLQSSGQDLYFAAVTLAGNGDLFFGMTFSSSTLDPSAVVLGVPGAAFGPVTGGIIYQSGSKAYTCNCGKGKFRWGDYSGAAKDPNDPTVAWVAQEFGGTASADWGTAIAAVFFGTPPPPAPPK